MRLTRLFGAALASLALVATSAGVASAANGNAVWAGNGTVSVAGNAATLTIVSGGSSLETQNLGRKVVAGDKITFDYTTSDGVCSGGAPRVFVKINGIYENTFDFNPNACGQGVPTGAGAQSGTVSYTIVNSGTITHTGVVADDPSQDGATFTVSNVTIAGQKVVFGAANGKL